MADDKIEIEVSLDESTITKSFDVIRRENEKSAKESADVFNKAFEDFHEQESRRLREENSLRLRQVDAMRNAAMKSAKESADAFQSAFSAQSKQWGQNLSDALTNKDAIRKSAKESAEVFAAAFDKPKEGMFDFKINLLAFDAALSLLERFKNAAVNASKALIDMGLEAEHVRVVGAQFEANTKQNAIATEAFNDAIQKSVAGLIDDDEALQLANNAMIRLGATAQNFPRILELARKASAAGYNDMRTNAELLTSAIQTGNTRQLKSLGIYVDVTKEQKKLADQLGLTTGQLNEQQQAVANANAILKLAEKQFGNVDANVKTFSDSLERLKVQAKDASERFSVSFSEMFGSAFIKLMDGAAASFSKNSEQYKLQSLNAADLSKKIAEMKEQVRSLQEQAAKSPFSAWSIDAQQEINDLKIRLAEAQKVQEQAAKSSKQLAEEQIAMQKRTADAIKLTEEQKQQAYINTLNASNAAIQRQIAIDQQAAANAQFNANNTASANERQQQLELEHQANIRMIAEQGAIERNNIEINYSNAKGFNQEARDAMELDQKRRQSDAMLREEQRYQTASQGQWGAYVQTAKNTMADFGNYAKTVLVKGFGTSLEAVGAALVKGENAFAAFGKAFLGVLGDIAIQAGNMFIALGIANQAIPVFGLTGFGAIAAGAALVVLGGALKALSGGGAESSQSGGGGVSNASSASDTGFNFNEPVAGGRIQPNTVINFTVNGSIMDSDDTQNRIIELLNSAIDSKGAVIRGL